MVSAFKKTLFLVEVVAFSASGILITLSGAGLSTALFRYALITFAIAITLHASRTKFQFLKRNFHPEDFDPFER